MSSTPPSDPSATKCEHKMERIYEPISADDYASVEPGMELVTYKCTKCGAEYTTQEMT